MALASEIDAIDRQTATDLARLALRNQAAEIIDWKLQPIAYHASNPVSHGVHRLAGRAIADGQMVCWALVLKVIRSPAGAEVAPGVTLSDETADPPPGHFANWRREMLAYECGALDDLPAALAAPRCLRLERRGSSAGWLWMEELSDAEGGRWGLTHYEQAARQLGRFNGAYLTGCPLPSEAWLGDGWLHSFIADMEKLGGWDAVPAALWRHPVVRGVFGSATEGRLRRLWDERRRFLSALDRLPRTFCHRDAFRSNLFWSSHDRRAEQLVAIDWAFTGIGPIGEEIAPLIVCSPSVDGSVSERELEPLVVRGYLRGLREAGWAGDELEVRFGYAASAVLRYIFSTTYHAMLDVVDPALRARAEGRAGQEIEAIGRRQAERLAFLLDLADKARALLPRVCPGR